MQLNYTENMYAICDSDDWHLRAGGGTNLMLIVGISAGVGGLLIFVVVIVIIAVLICVFCRKPRRYVNAFQMIAATGKQTPWES